MAQLVARDVWDVDAAGSNPVTPTKICALCTKKSVLFARLGLIFCLLYPIHSVIKRPQFFSKTLSFGTRYRFWAFLCVLSLFSFENPFSLLTAMQFLRDDGYSLPCTLPCHCISYKEVICDELFRTNLCYNGTRQCACVQAYEWWNQFTRNSFGSVKRYTFNNRNASKLV